ncbi:MULTISPECIES: MFS transporter [Leuconostoc]|jgi:OHS family lactose permease-like MFS transporter|uniref:Sucrose permease, major facilitator superfamily n=2 Tax=Leuconostoc TaxID=1243 RepID=A0AAN2QTS5_9LACO|nr:MULTISPECIES: MFS transporter [Leuconostoc]AFS39531.1 galactoside permease [Leuconostoc gelidum JB7]MBZ5944949.1 MFS transporter [Leuconostoc gasicomitatum]MBZ5945790.1 MFS transporter [Leuconostoc gasicomitatum]MBZ5947171.1 MFS transporter [Leuconostoc gasicomitatum]MBZ5949798.1 MFS transporter [Leuconostoc gasicomitatum]
MNSTKSRLRSFKNASYLQSSTSMLLFFASWGIWWSFYQLWLTSPTSNGGLGLSGAQVGTIFSANSLFSLILMFVYGAIQDRLFIKRYLLIFNAIISTLIGPFFIWVYAPLLTNHFVIGMWVGAIVLSTGFLSAVGILEAVTERFSRVFSFEYGQARAWGSFGYAIVALLAGLLFVINPQLNFWFGSIFGILLLANLIFWVPKEERDAKQAISDLAREDSIPKLSDMLHLLKLPELWQVIIFIIFSWTFYTIFDSQMFPDFYTKLFSSPALGQHAYGTLNSIQVFFEAIMLGVVPIIMRKIGVKRTLMIGVVIMFMRIGLCGFNTNPYTVSAIKMLHSLEVPMFTLSIFRYFTLHFNTKLSASLYMIGFQIAAQIGQVILSTPLGILRDHVGYQNTFHVISVMVLLAGIYAFFVLKKDSQDVNGTPLAKI